MRTKKLVSFIFGANLSITQDCRALIYESPEGVPKHLPAVSTFPINVLKTFRIAWKGERFEEESCMLEESQLGCSGYEENKWCRIGDSQNNCEFQCSVIGLSIDFFLGKDGITCYASSHKGCSGDGIWGRNSEGSFKVSVVVVDCARKLFVLTVLQAIFLANSDIDLFRHA